MTFFQGNFFRKAIPFLLFVGGGSFALSIFTSIRYETSQSQRALTRQEKEALKELGVKPLKVDLLEEYKELKENMDIDNWENIRGPRPWEADEEKYIDIINKRIEEQDRKRKEKGTFWV